MSLSIGSFEYLLGQMWRGELIDCTHLVWSKIIKILPDSTMFWFPHIITYTALKHTQAHLLTSNAPVNSIGASTRHITGRRACKLRAMILRPIFIRTVLIREGCVILFTVCGHKCFKFENEMAHNSC